MKPTKFYEMTDEQKEKHLKKTMKMIEKGANELFIKMNSIVKRHVKRYIADFLVHDLYVLEEKNETFLWLVRECGTNLIQLDDPEFEKGTWKWIDWYEAIKHSMKTKEYYLVDNKNKTIKKLTPDKADQLMKSYNEKYTAEYLKEHKVA